MIKTRQGLTIIEVLVAVAIIGITVTIVVSSFGKINQHQALSKDAALVVSVLSEARARALSSVEAEQYGVHLEESQIVLFKGPSYLSTDPDNEVVTLNSLVSIRDIILTGGGSDVIFKRLSGETDQPGSLQLYLEDEPTTFRIVTISATGVVEEN